MEKNIFKIIRGLIEALSRILRGRTESNHKNSSHDNRLSNRDFKPGCSKHEAGVIITGMRLSACSILLH